eukprot:TRINITY_DN2282_c0_g1_i1.p1 TRINITY_DN2282_c0_g1~~TRINITY_DN2282_c0_g1_i1.p1  ORF type:complete len:899 (-),score=92.25 TRINITY_DN2282_c0_g1_i1:1381-4077(-)
MQDKIQAVCQLLRDFATPEPAKQQAAQQQLTQLEGNHEFAQCLVDLLTGGAGQPEEIRRNAGFLLENNLASRMQGLPPDTLKYIMMKLVQCLSTPNEPQHVRLTVRLCILKITQVGSLGVWKHHQINLVQGLTDLTANSDAGVVEASLSTLAKICEDCGDQLDQEDLGRPLNQLFPKLLEFFKHSAVECRRHAITGIVNILQCYSLTENVPNALKANVDVLLQSTFLLAEKDTDIEVRKNVCTFFSLMLEAYQVIKNQIQNIFNYILAQMSAGDEKLALEACEFWYGIAEIDMAKSDLQPLLPRLLPVLLTGMVYSEEEQATLGGQDDDADVPDRDWDIHPSMLNKAAAARNRGYEGDDDEEDDDEGGENQWTLRKCCAGSLDMLSGLFSVEILPILMPLVHERMQPQHPWQVRESAILALGAISEGCYTGIVEYLPNVVEYLLEVLRKDPKPLVRGICCWTLSRYSKWICCPPSPEHQKFREQALDVLLQVMAARNKSVQEAACSALSNFEEDLKINLAPYLPNVLAKFKHCFGFYQAKNILLLYDAVVTMCDAVGDKLNDPQYIQLLMPPLIERWQGIPDDDHKLLPVLSCMTSVAQAMGAGFLNFAEPCFQRCIKIIQNNYQVRQQAAAQGYNNEAELPEKEFVVCALDLLSGMADGLGGAIEPFVSNSPILQLLLECLKDESPGVRQSAFAILGDFAKNCMGQLARGLPEYMNMLRTTIDANQISQGANASVSNNAIWALGEIAMQLRGDMAQFVGPFVEQLVPILSINLSRNLLENAAICVGRLSFVCPDQVAPRVKDFIQPWCYYMRSIKEGTEKEHALLGLCQVIRKNPNGVFDSFAYVCDAFTSWGQPPKQVKDEFAQILNTFKQHASWNEFFKSFPESIRNHLIHTYGM